MRDAAFTIQAILSSNLAEEYGHVLKKAHDFVKSSQVTNLSIARKQLACVGIHKHTHRRHIGMKLIRIAYAYVY